MSVYDFSPVYAGLKDFQRATVDYVFQRMYLDEEPTRRFLVADEVGLGKTLVARGLIARAIEHLQHEVPRIDIVYICSNASIARQNVQRLNVTRRQDFSLPDRITLLPLHLDQVSKNPLNFISFTPGTALDLKHQSGTRRERALLYWMLRRAWGEGLFEGVRAMNVFQGTITRTKRWREYLRDFENESVSRELSRKFKQAVRDADRLARETGNQTFKRRFKELLEVFTRADKAYTRRQRALRNAFIEDLRSVLARSCIDALQPDLIILDEFQRFRHLLDGTDPAAELAHDLFRYESARVLLLSATPYKMYTLSDESDQDDHYQDFLRTVAFLMPKEVEEFAAELTDFRRSLLHFSTDVADRSRAARTRVETRLRKVMARTERLAVTPDRAGMLTEKPVTGLRLEADDIRAYLTLARLATRLGAGDVLEYWKSAPYLLNFMEHYELVRLLEEAEEQGLGSEMAAILAKGNGLLPSRDELARWDEIDPANARLRALVADTVERGAWRLLWLPPSLPYYRPGPPYDDPDLQSLTKRLVFSAWTVVPKTIATLVSYEAERRMATAGGEHLYANTAEDRARIRPLLRWHRTEGRLQGMALLALVYPSVVLARLGDPLQLASQELSDRGQMLDTIKSRIEEQLNPFLKDAPSTGPVDESWYWAAPLLLDSIALRREASDWLADPGLAAHWGTESGDHEDSPETKSEEKPLSWHQLEVGSTYNFRKPGGYWNAYVVVGKSNNEIDLRPIWFDEERRRWVGRLQTRLRDNTEFHEVWSTDPIWRDVPAPETLRPGRFYALRFGTLERHGSFLVEGTDGDAHALRRVRRDKDTGELELAKTRRVPIEEIDLLIEDETERWAGRQVRVPGVLGQVLSTAQAASGGQSPSGRVPDDLIEVLAHVALAAPGVCALRAMSRIAGGSDGLADPTVRNAAAAVAWSLRNLFNLPDVSALLRASEPDEPYWRATLDYCTNGNLQAVLDEYAHVLPEWLGLIDQEPHEVAAQVAETMQQAVSLRAASYSVDEIAPQDGELLRDRHRLRGRFAIRFGDEWSSPDLTDIREVGNNPREDVLHGKETATTETIVHAGVQG